ncbi:uncharacterized protein MONBRDRAFT_37386 [Monosiga brevicollis MX1]|uniref:Uncharacterized protein n=1 Tax=Monosiga brevicollis TaxID=81824 RepID=A9V1D7_MONBE|nr:uncharacterized protein MONBRDRAFT_37386 [Monosiga brevicollis MX1]EDQ88422.1 predicted protein [Monosiga brevicollis MX1]|eukprot:XP_001746526.1 hypothetical protein [Monosiga brevicollis MX1]
MAKLLAVMLGLLAQVHLGAAAAENWPLAGGIGMFTHSTACPAPTSSLSAVVARQTAGNSRSKTQNSQPLLTLLSFLYVPCRFRRNVAIIETLQGTASRQGPGEDTFRFAILFAEPMPDDPYVSIDMIAIDGDDFALAFADDPVTDPRGFIVDVLCAEPALANATIHWRATFQGPCEAHSHCPDSQYCDTYAGCDDCMVCHQLQDTFDGGACPERCMPKVSEPEEFDFPSPCLVCPERTYPCGNACVDVYGLELPECYASPGCAVGFQRGSLTAYNDNLFSLNSTYATQLKADAALARVNSIDPNYAPRELYESLSRVRSTSLCATVECAPPETCYGEATCTNGVCSTNPFLAAGTECDDGNNRTTSDVCDGAGTCAGIDLCDGVVCTALDQCHVPGECFQGVCSNPPAPVGTVCDDGLVYTNDTCNGFGQCIGVDLCENVTCTAASQCHAVGVCSFGSCSDPVLPEGVPCDDGIAYTNDTCDGAGACVGVDLCDGVVCLPPSQCHVQGTCSFGECTPVPAMAGTPCDDGLSYTNDTCDGWGVCVGVDLCENVTCTPASQCHDVGTCSFGSCSNPTKSDGTPCDDGNGMTDFDECVAGVCQGVLQPTVGPTQSMGFQTVAVIELITPNASLATISAFIAAAIPGVYGDDVHVNETLRELRATASAIRDVQRLELRINTRVFGETYVVSQLDMLLNSSTFAALTTTEPDGKVVILSAPHAILRCLTDEVCPALSCADDEIEYQSQYPSVRRCCAVCLRRALYDATEIEAYQKATQHWMAAQAEQDADFVTRDLAEYEQELAAFKMELEAYETDAAAWDLEWANYTTREELFYRLTCP